MRKYLLAFCLSTLVGCASHMRSFSDLEKNSWIRCGQIMEKYNRAIIERIYPTKDAAESHNLMLNQMINGNLGAEKRLEILDSIEQDIIDYRNKKSGLGRRDILRV